MDALDILSDLENVTPFFQPIFSADEHRIIGYEVLGRYINQGEPTSMGAFFHDDQIPEDYRLEVDNVVLQKALEKAILLEDDLLLFINRDASLLMHHDGEPLLEMLLAAESNGFSLNRIVLEIDDRHFSGNPEQLDHLLNYYRTFGIKIAIDKMGDDSSHLDRIGQLKPDILKVNLNALRSTAIGTNFEDIIYTLALLARKIGATLLFENIEMSYQLQFAWRTGGRFYQGYYLAGPSAEFVERNMKKDDLREEIHRFILREKKKLEALFAATEFFQVVVQETVAKFKKTGDFEDLFNQLTKKMDKIAFRMYVCDEDGFQKSANIFKSQAGWTIQQEYLHKNWSWRSYFLENMFKMKNEKKGLLSDLYSDIETGETIRTFSFPIDSQHFLFIDIAYDYLYENDGLL